MSIKSRIKGFSDVISEFIGRPWMFYALVLLNTWPIFSYRYFPTYDGPAHLYNSKLFREILFERETLLNYFYEIRWESFPNWTDHLFLSILGAILPSDLAEKILILIFFILLPLSFRVFLKSLPNSDLRLSLLILPFTMNFTFMMGFFNFNLAICMMFFTLALWIKKKANPDLISLVTITLMFLLLYFTHLIVFLITICIIAFYVIVLNYKVNNSNLKRDFLQLLITTAFPLVLSIGFILSQHSSSQYESHSFEMLFHYFTNFSPLVVFNDVGEEPYTQLFAIFILFLFVGRLLNKLRSETFFKRSDLWLVLALFFLSLFFFFPDATGTGGYYSFRLFIIFSLLLITWFSTSKSWVKMDHWLIIAYVITSFQLSKKKERELELFNSIANSIVKASEQIEEQSVVLPIISSVNWYLEHISNYAGISKPMVILENYEAGLQYFPVKWKSHFSMIRPDGTLAASEELASSVRIEELDKTFNIDYILVIGYDENEMLSSKKNKSLLVSDYELIQNDQHIRLFRNRDSAP